MPADAERARLRLDEDGARLDARDRALAVHVRRAVVDRTVATVGHPHRHALGVAVDVHDDREIRIRHARDAEIVVGNLDARREITDVRDTVRAYRLLVERGTPGRPYNVCSGRAIGIGEVVDRLIARSKTRVRIRVDPARFRPNDVPLVAGNPARIRQELGWTPQIPLEQTLDDLLNYWREQVARLKPRVPSAQRSASG